jgi:hypothetical protein
MGPDDIGIREGDQTSTRASASRMPHSSMPRTDKTLARTDCAANYLDSVSVSPRDQLAVREDQVLRGKNLSWIGEVALAWLRSGETDVIRAFEQHNVSYTRQCQNIPVESSQGAETKGGADTGAVAQQPIPSYTLIDYSRLGTL